MKKLIVLIALVAAGSAFAESTYPYVDFTGVKLTKTRAEVIAEMKQPAVAAKEYVDFAAADAQKSRAEVRHELSEARTARQATDPVKDTYFGG